MTELNKIYALLGDAKIPASICNGNREFVCLNEACSEFFGFEKDELLGKSHRLLVSMEELGEDQVAEIRSKVDEGTPFAYQIKNRRRNGETYLMGVFVIPFVDGGDSVPYTARIYRELASEEDSGTFGAAPEFRKLVEDVLALIEN